MDSHGHDADHAGPTVQSPPAPALGLGPLEVRDIPLNAISVGESCRRRSYDDIDGLIKSIEEDGLLQPVTVNAAADGRFTLVCGSRRYKAHEQLGRTTIACRVVTVSPAKAAVLALTENVNREDIHPVELASQIQSAMTKFGYSQEAIANHIGWSQSTISALVAILDLEENIRQQIGTLPESPFKRTHAEILAELLRSTRVNRTVEVQTLFKKTVKHSLTTKELKALVQLIRANDGYARLPERLRTSLLQEKGMTAQVARWYLEPTQIIDGEGKEADRQRRIAEGLDKKWLENYLVKAAKAGWGQDKTKQGLLAVVKEHLQSAQGDAREPKSSWQKLVEDVSVLEDRLAICGDDLPNRAQSDPRQLAWLCAQLTRLRSNLDRFLNAAADSIDRNPHGQSVTVDKEIP